MKVIKAEFTYGAMSEDQLPKPSLPEFAFAGKSNVGKSSLINKLTNRKALARTSSTPGRTRQINFFNINDKMMFVDLPGYGFAKVSKGEREHWGRLITAYLTDRSALKAVIAILDVRRDPSDEDGALLDMLEDLGVPTIVVITKTDKVKRGELAQRKSDIATTIEVPATEIVSFSAETGAGRDEIWREILKRV